MTVSLSTRPDQLVAGQPAHVDFASSTSSGNFLKGYITDAPIGSSANAQLLESAAKVPVFALDLGKSWDVTFEVGGVYTLQVELYVKGASLYGGGYEGAPDGYQTESLINDFILTIEVGQKVTQEIGFGPDTATLTLFVIGDNVVHTTVPQHGFTSPVIAATTSEKAKTAALNPAITAATAALAGQTVTVLLGDVMASLNNLLSRFNNHAQSGVYHPTPDFDNVVLPADLVYPAVSPEGVKNAARAFIGYLGRHMTNDSGAGAGSAMYHVSSRSDWANALLVSSAGGDVHDAFVAHADLWRSFEAHRQDATVHTVDDTTNHADPLPPLLNLHRLFLTELAKQSPTAPASVNSGVTALVHGAGFEEL